MIQFSGRDVEDLGVERWVGDDRASPPISGSEAELQERLRSLERTIEALAGLRVEDTLVVALHVMLPARVVTDVWAPFGSVVKSGGGCILRWQE